MRSISLVAAIGTPLTQNESLHAEGLEAHLADQWDNGMTGVLVGGTMGAMQILKESTYEQLVERSIELSRGRGEVMIGVGDTGFARTRERIQALNEFKVDGVVVLTPFFLRFSQAELLAYFRALADESRNPLFLYDLPGLTGVKLELDTVLQLAKHPKIRGIKCSGDLGSTRQLIDAAPPPFRVIVAQADLVDVLLRHGVREHLDGVFALAPFWVSAIRDAAAAADWNTAARCQQQLSALLRVLKQFGVFQAFTAILNARGIPGNFAPAPMLPLSDAQHAALMAEPVVQELLRRRASKSMPDERVPDFQPAK